MALEQGINLNDGQLNQLAFELSSQERVERIRQVNSDAENAGEQYRAVLNEITSQISELTRLKLSIKGAVREDVDQYKQLRESEAHDLEESLIDPQCPDHIAYRTAMLLPRMGGSSLEEPERFEAAHALSEQLLNLDQTLRNSTEPQQIITFNYMPTHFGDWYTSLDITFGFTQPLEGLTNDQAQEPDDLSSSLLVPVDEASLHGVHPSMYSPEWYHGGVVNYVNGTKDQTPSNLIPKAHKPTIVLPTGAIYVEGAKPLVMYDQPGGKVAEINVQSWTNNFGEKSFVAIGKKSVARTLNHLVQRSREMAASNHPDMRTHPSTLSDMRGFVISGLKKSRQTAK